MGALGMVSVGSRVMVFQSREAMKSRVVSRVGIEGWVDSWWDLDRAIFLAVPDMSIVSVMLRRNWFRVNGVEK